ncbi:MAG: hypothetical protein ACRELY_23820 [Polyangiaceae bacterium]
MRARLSLAVATTAFLLARSALGGDPFEIQVYDGTADHALTPGIELHLNDWAAGNRTSAPPEAPLHGQLHATLEPSFGITSFWEVGAYLQGALRTDVDHVDFGGAKLRSKFVTPPTWDPHWRLGANFELSYLPSTYDHDRWGSEVRPIVAWHDANWLFAFNPIFDQPFAGSDAADGPSFEPALKIARTVGPVAVGIEYYATLGPLGAIEPWQHQEQQIFEVIDLLSVEHFELNAGIGEGLTQDSRGTVLKMIVGYEFDREAPRSMTARQLRSARTRTN